MTSPSRLNAPTAKDEPAFSRTDEVVKRISIAIALGEYLPGSKLPSERQLSAALDVARVTVRSAIGRLVKLGLLEVKVGGRGGTFVKEPNSYEASVAIERVLTDTWERLVDLQETEVRIHGLIAEVAAERRTEEDLREIEHFLSQYREADSIIAAQSADRDFHLAVVKATHSDSLAELVRTVERRLHVSAPAHPVGSESQWGLFWSRSLADHEEIFGLISSSDAEAARIAGSRHALINRDLLEEALSIAKKRIEDSSDLLMNGPRPSAASLGRHMP